MLIKSIGDYEVYLLKPSAYEIIRHLGVFFKFMEDPQVLKAKDIDEFVMALLGNCKAIEQSTQKEFRLISPQVLMRVFGDDLKALLEFLAELLQDIFQLSSQFLNSHTVASETSSKDQELL